MRGAYRQPDIRPYIAAVLGGGVVMGAVMVAAADVSRHRGPSDEARAVVDAVNALVEGDAPIAAAECTPCALDRLPTSRAALVALLVGPHRGLIEEAARGSVRVRRRVEHFNPLELIDEPVDGPEAAAVVHGFFSGRPVDVVVGTGLTAGPYPLAFDWAVVLDPRSGTLFSFVLNCRD